eukprot:3462637-Prymnesium_polylepis.1
MPYEYTNALRLPRWQHNGCPGGLGDESALHRHSFGPTLAANTTINMAKPIVFDARAGANPT